VLTPLRDHLTVTWGVILVVSVALLIFALRSPIRRLSLDNDSLVLMRMAGDPVRVPRSAIRSMRWLWASRSGPVAVIGSHDETLLTLDDFEPGDLERLAAALGVGLELEPGGGTAQRVSGQQRQFGWLLVGAAALFLVVTGFATWSYFTTTSDISRYESAPRCSGAAASGCRFSGDATILRKYTSGADAVDVSFVNLGPRVYTAQIQSTDSHAWDGWSAGKTLPGEIWEGSVTRLGGVLTADNPHNRGANSLLIPLVFAAFGAGALLTGVSFLRGSRQLSSSPNVGGKAG
jgi:hypothetical protein